MTNYSGGQGCWYCLQKVSFLFGKFLSFLVIFNVSGPFSELRGSYESIFGTDSDLGWNFRKSFFWVLLWWPATVRIDLRVGSQTSGIPDFTRFWSKKSIWSPKIEKNSKFQKIATQFSLSCHGLASCQFSSPEVVSVSRIWTDTVSWPGNPVKSPTLKVSEDFLCIFMDFGQKQWGPVSVQIWETGTLPELDIRHELSP